MKGTHRNYGVSPTECRYLRVLLRRLVFVAPKVIVFISIISCLPWMQFKERHREERARGEGRKQTNHRHMQDAHPLPTQESSHLSCTACWGESAQQLEWSSSIQTPPRPTPKGPHGPRLYQRDPNIWKAALVRDIPHPTHNHNGSPLVPPPAVQPSRRLLERHRAMHSLLQHTRGKADGHNGVRFDTKEQASN